MVKRHRQDCDELPPGTFHESDHVPGTYHGRDDIRTFR